MSRVIIQIKQGDLAGTTFRVELEEPRIGDAALALEFPFDPTAPAVRNFSSGNGTVTEIGSYLLGCLRSHPTIDQAITQLLAAQPTDPPQPLFVRMGPRTEAWPWEALFAEAMPLAGGGQAAEAGFLSLDVRWPVARMNFDGYVASPTFDFEPPLRVMAILGAAGVEARPEWDALYENLRHLPFRVEIHAFVAEDALHAHISGIADPNVDIRVDWVPATTDLVAAIGRIRPNILHVFCHGRVEGNAPLVLIATRDSWAEETGGIVLEPSDLAVEAARGSLWLATMNCCRGAQGTETGSLVYGLLRHGFPAVAGMREAVSYPDAHAFCRGFYAALVELLAPAATVGREVALDLPRALHRPRREICEEHRVGDVSCDEAAATNREWTLPVLYVRSGGVTVRNRAGQAAQALSEQDRIRLETQLRVLQDLVRSPIAGTPDSAIQAYTAQIATLETMLYAAQPVGT
jgi:hypothetical protein